MEQSCKNCRFWINVSGSREVGYGQCRRQPPTVTDHYPGRFPRISEQEWCGEWQPVRPETLTEWAARAVARYDAMSPEEKAAHDKAQRESFARGMMPTGDPRFD